MDEERKHFEESWQEKHASMLERHQQEQAHNTGSLSAVKRP